MTVQIKARHRGPFLVTGDIELHDENGELIDTSGQTKVALCRCGASKSAPLCDGSHNRLPSKSS